MGFAVDVDTLRREGVEAGLVVVAVPPGHERNP